MLTIRKHDQISSLSFSGTFDPFTVSGNNVYLTGYNLWIQSGAGSTFATPNGLGNLIIGYNETRGGTSDDRNGSHNIIVGDEENYSSYGGIVAGLYNSIANKYACIVGGADNTASGSWASVSGGGVNTASGPYSSVSGGSGWTANGG